MDFGLNGEQQIIVDTVRSFVENEIYPLEEEVERAGQVAPEIGDEIRRKVLELGFFAPNMPADIGGGGLDQLAFALLERELGRGSQALTIFWGRPSNIYWHAKVSSGNNIFCQRLGARNTMHSL